MHKLTCYPIGNADCTLIELANGRTIVFDYADMRNANDSEDRRIDLQEALGARLQELGKTSVDVLVFTHIDLDHIKGAHKMFAFEHADKYQQDGQIPFGELWVPACAVVESDLNEDARIIRQEARYRLKEGAGIRVFSRPDVLKEWLTDNGIAIEDRAHLFVDAGQLVPGFTRAADGLEVFVHSPFAQRLGDGSLIDRNTNAIFVQMAFAVNGIDTRLVLGADAGYEILSEIVDITRYHSRDERLAWDVFHLPHHCSYTALGPDKGTGTTEPVENVRWLFEEQGQKGAIIVSPSQPIPLTDAKDGDLPPHRQAANYYKGVASALGGKFVVTMEHPTQASPKPLTIVIDETGGRVTGLVTSAISTTVSQRAPKAG